LVVKLLQLAVVLVEVDLEVETEPADSDRVERVVAWRSKKIGLVD
jgi:hypothetical protein